MQVWKDSETNDMRRFYLTTTTLRLTGNSFVQLLVVGSQTGDFDNRKQKQKIWRPLYSLQDKFWLLNVKQKILTRENRQRASVCHFAACQVYADFCSRASNRKLFVLSCNFILLNLYDKFFQTIEFPLICIVRLTEIYIVSDKNLSLLYANTQIKKLIQLCKMPWWIPAVSQDSILSFWFLVDFGKDFESHLNLISLQSAAWETLHRKSS